MQELRNDGNKKISEPIEATSIKQFKIFDSLISSHKIEKPSKDEDVRYENKYLAQQYLEHINSEDEIPTVEEYEVYINEMMDEEFFMRSDEE